MEKADAGEKNDDNYKAIRLEDIQNFVRLQCLLNSTATPFLRDMFQKTWKSLQGSEWQNSQIDVQIFLEGNGNKLFKAAKPIQLDYLSNKNINTWDLPLLIDAIKSLQGKEMNDKFNTIFENLKKVRNQMAHAGKLELTEEQFQQKWEETCAILLKLGVPQKDLDTAKSFKLQDDEVTKPESNNDKENTQQALKLKVKGNELFKARKFSESIKVYSEAILLPGIPTNDLAVLYSNRCMAFIKCKDFQSAKADAKGAVHLRPSWWKGYSRLATAYQELSKFDNALKYNEIALGMEPTAVDVKDDRDYCRHMIAQMARNEHTDPMNFVDTFEEVGNKWPGGLSAAELVFRQNLNYQTGLPFGICGEAHKYLYGRGVPQNFEMAAQLFAKAAGKGSAEGMFNLALLTSEGKGVRRSVKESIQWLLQAANQEPIIDIIPGCSEIKIPNIGVMEAQHSLGLWYETGVGFPQNYNIAFQWYKKSLDNGSGRSANNIAIMFSTGMGVQQDMKKAFLYWKVAALKGDVRAMENLANNFFYLGDLHTAQKWYTYAVAKGSVSLQLEKEKFMFDGFPLKDFDCDDFQSDLNEELLESSLRDVVLPKEVSFDKMAEQCASLNKTVDPLSDEYKKKIILEHRTDVHEMKSRGQRKLECQKTPAKLLPKPVFDLVGLKTINFKDMDQHHDNIYEGFVIKLTLIEDAVLGKPSIALIGIDSNGDIQRIFVYNFPQNKETQYSLGFGCRISIVNPYFRITLDRKPAIRVDDTSLMFLHSNLVDKNQCRNCNKSKGTVICRKCRRAFYCSKKCLTIDADEMQHNLVCFKHL